MRLQTQFSRPGDAEQPQQALLASCDREAPRPAAEWRCGVRRALAWAVLFWSALALLPSPSLHARQRAIVVIVHPSAAVHDLGLAELRSIFSSSQKRFSSGRRAIPFNAASGSPLRVTFDRAVLNLERDEVAKFWIDQRIRGRERPPRQIDNEATIQNVVAALPGAIAYVFEDRLQPGVVVVARIVDGDVRGPDKGAAR